MEFFPLAFFINFQLKFFFGKIYNYFNKDLITFASKWNNFTLKITKKKKTLQGN